ncbi:MAG: hypothetical protein QOI47_2145 [Actinomycetota bacterium]|nr:hypothetical protein [Actinomycetota bacterium]
MTTVTASDSGEAQLSTGVRWLLRTAAFGAALVLVCTGALLRSELRAGADAPAAVGWWSQASSLPPPPDVSTDGLYVQGGPSGPIAIAALRFELPPDEGADHLQLIPNGTSSPSATVQVCPLKAASVDFKTEQNGAWADAPAYDCGGANAVVGKADPSGALSFSVGGLVQDGVLAVAVIATGPADRVPIAKPDASALTTIPSPSAPSASSDAAGSTYDSSTSPYSSASGSSSFSVTPASPPDEPVPAAAPVGGSAAAAGPAARPGPDAPLAIAAPSPHDLATRLGGLVAISILVAALVAYSLGFGLLGGRFADS